MKKFYAVIGNPPYQKDPEAGSSRALPVYDSFMDESYKLSDKVELITPARFLFNAGQTKKEWNEKMLNDEHLRVLKYMADSSEVFAGQDIMGGVVVTLHDNTKEYIPIGSFIPFDELRSITEKVAKDIKEKSIADISFSQNNYNFDTLYADHPNYSQYISGEGHHSQLKSNALMKVPIFTEEPQSDDDVIVYGLVDGKRGSRFCNPKYLKPGHPNMMFYKVILPNSNGSDAIGKTDEATVLIGEPFIAPPKSGYTQTYMSIGICGTENEANNVMKYIKTKFARVLLGTLKVTQANPPITWKNVPCQDFSANSDINWEQSISEINKQLYKKYNLSQEEIEFTETHIKEMT